MSQHGVLPHRSHYNESWKLVVCEFGVLGHVLVQFGIGNHKQKISNIHKTFLNYINFS